MGAEALRCNASVSGASKGQGSTGCKVSSDLRLESDPVDERAIIARCLAGDRRAYALLVERYKALVHDLVSRMLGDAAEAEDIAQEAFVKAYLTLRDFRGESRFSTWVCRIALNRCKDVLRKQRRAPWLRPRYEDGPDVAEVADDQETPAHSAERCEREAALQRALARLPVKYREVVVLRHIEGMELHEIARVLGIAVGAVKVRAFRAREMLRRLLLQSEGAAR
jgi:RNA polymerase sigma-70 factor (ECF subfamily)